jgi:tetratricopeptide (TPR) repeat protein
MIFDNHSQESSSDNRRSPGVAVLHGLITTALTIMAAPAPAQNISELSHLIFEPVLVNVIELDDDLQVEEITSLPRADSPQSSTEYLYKTFIAEQQPEPGDLDQTIIDYERSIRDLEIQGGAYEYGLSQEFVSLGMIYQSRNEHELALEHFDKALHINRVNLGLFNLEQEEVIEKQIESYIALGDLQSADHQQEYLFFLKRRAYGGDSVELLPALTRYAEWNIFAFDSRLAMDPTLSYAAESSIYTDNGVSNSIGAEDFRTIRLMNAQNIYRTMIQILLNNFGVDDPRLLDIERRLALTNYFFATNMDINSDIFSNGNNSSLALASSQGFYDMSRVSSNSMGYRHGREALERRLQYILRSEAVNPEKVARARVDLADWLMLFKKRVAALEVYEAAYRELKAANGSQEVMDELFSPMMPVTIPTFIDYRFTRAYHDIPEDVALDYKGWLDVSVKINRFGQTSDVEVLGKSLSVTDPIESRLVRQLRSSTSFRPRFSNDALLTEDRLTARFYYTY